MKIGWDDKCIVQYPMFLDYQGRAGETRDEKLLEAVILIIDFLKWCKNAVDYYEKNGEL